MMGRECLGQLDWAHCSAVPRLLYRCISISFSLFMAIISNFSIFPMGLVGAGLVVVGGGAEVVGGGMVVVVGGAVGIVKASSTTRRSLFTSSSAAAPSPPRSTKATKGRFWWEG